MKVIAKELSSIALKFVRFINNLFDSSRADKLLIAAFVVAVLRQMGVNGHFIGYDPASQWNWFQPLEVFSGIAMAILIGLALAYIARRWRAINPQTWTDWTYWGIVLTGMIIVFICEVFYTALYAYAAQRAGTVATTFTPGVNMLWNITVAGVLPLMAILIGIVNNEDMPEEVKTTDEYDDAWLMLIELLKSGDVTNISPRQLSAEALVSLESAQAVIKDAYRVGLLK